MKKIFDTIIEYGSQNSTWRGLIGLATAAGIAISPELGAQIIATGMGAIGIINVVRNGNK